MLFQKNKSPFCALCTLRFYVKIVSLYAQWGGILLERVSFNLNSNDLQRCLTNFYEVKVEFEL